jgi:ketosteroid isomerase-like protein
VTHSPAITAALLAGEPVGLRAEDGLIAELGPTVTPHPGDDVLDAPGAPPAHPTDQSHREQGAKNMTTTSAPGDSLQILTRAFASDWGKGKPPALEGAMHPEAELIVPESMPYGGGVFRGQERIEQWFAEDLWQLWAEFSSTPTDFIDGGEKVVVPVHVKGKTHDGTEVEADNVWIYEFEDGKLRRARVVADTATIRDAVTGVSQRRTETAIVLTAWAPSRNAYEAVHDQVGGTAAGLIVHTASEVDGKVRIVEVWESRQQFDEFVQSKLGPALEKLSAQMDPPETTETFSIERG